MKFLLDTQAFLWFVLNDRVLSQVACAYQVASSYPIFYLCPLLPGTLTYADMTTCGQRYVDEYKDRVRSSRLFEI